MQSRRHYWRAALVRCLEQLAHGWTHDVCNFRESMNGTTASLRHYGEQRIERTMNNISSYFSPSRHLRGWFAPPLRLPLSAAEEWPPLRRRRRLLREDGAGVRRRRRDGRAAPDVVWRQREVPLGQVSKLIFIQVRLALSWCSRYCHARSIIWFANGYELPLDPQGRQMSN